MKQAVTQGPMVHVKLQGFSKAVLHYHFYKIAKNRTTVHMIFQNWEKNMVNLLLLNALIVLCCILTVEKFFKASMLLLL